MIAIRLTKKNLHKILNESPIQRRDLEAMVEEYDTPMGPNIVFFVPQHHLAHELSATSWMTIPYRLLDENYDFDHKAIDSEFVEIAPK